MSDLYYKALPLLGVNRHIVKDWCLLSERYQGFGLLNFTTDCLVEKLHYIQCKQSFNSIVETLMIHAHEAFIVEVRVDRNVFTCLYESAGCLATDGNWFKNYESLLQSLVQACYSQREYTLHQFASTVKWSWTGFWRNVWMTISQNGRIE